MASQDVVRVGVVGTGVGIRTHLPAFRDLDNVEVVAIAGSTTDRTIRFAKEHNIRQAMDAASLCTLPEIDLVCVASPSPFHHSHAMAALNAGKHVLCEKPLAMTLQETSELIELSHARPKQLALVNHQLRFNPYIMRVRELIAEGAIGRPYYIRLHQQSTSFANRQAPWTWSFDSNQGGGVRLAMASHLIDLVRYWCDGEIETVCGTMDPVVRRRHSPSGQSMQVKASGFFCATLSLSSRLSVHLSATAASCGVPAFEFALFGEEGELHFDLNAKLTVASIRKPGDVKQVPVDGVTVLERENRVSIFSGSFRYFAPVLVTAIREADWGGLKPAATFGDAEGVQVVLDAIAQAANSGTMTRLSGDVRHDDLV